MKNSLIFKTQKTVGKETIYVKIRLDDQCKNGHQDFSITGDIYQAGKPKDDRCHLSGGCIHDEILAAFPEFKIFVNLHLCDYRGIPMHAAANGFYFLKNGFNNSKPGQENFKSEFCDYYRITPDQFEILKESENQLFYSIQLEKLGILESWNQEAEKAIEILENLTGEKFLIDSKKSQFEPIPEEMKKAEEEKIKSGFYSPDLIKQRAAAAKVERDKKILQDLENQKNKEIEKSTNDFLAKKAVFLAGGERALKSMIFYSHTAEIVFNWKSYDQINQAEFDLIKEKISLPDFVKEIKFKK